MKTGFAQERGFGRRVEFVQLSRDQAVVLRRLDYSETSQVLVFFTREHGKVRAIAKGIRRGTKTRFAAGIDLLEIGRIVFSSRGERREALATLTEWKQANSLPGLRQSLMRIQAAQYAAEVTAALTEDWDPHAELFDVLVDFLLRLCETAGVHELVVRYQLALLEAIGSLPRFDACVLCGRESDLTFFSSFEGGLICRHCEPGQVEKRELTPASASILRAWTAGEDASPGVDEASMTGLFSALNYHLAHLMGREPMLASKVVPTLVQRTLGPG